MAFVQPFASSIRTAKAQGKDCTCSNGPSRRDFLLSSGLSLAAASLHPLRVSAGKDENTSASTAEGNDSPIPAFDDDELCYVCDGRGLIPCQLCDGSGMFVTDDNVVIDRAMTCPSCAGGGTVGCLKCIGTGLSDTKGFLRDASQDGRIRMRRNGTYEVLKCGALPSCAIYGLGRTEANSIDQYKGSG